MPEQHEKQLICGKQHEKHNVVSLLQTCAPAMQLSLSLCLFLCLSPAPSASRSMPSLHVCGDRTLEEFVIRPINQPSKRNRTSCCTVPDPDCPQSNKRKEKQRTRSLSHSQPHGASREIPSLKKSSLVLICDRRCCHRYGMGPGIGCEGNHPICVRPCFLAGRARCLRCHEGLVRHVGGHVGHCLRIPRGDLEGDGELCRAGGGRRRHSAGDGGGGSCETLAAELATDT